MASSSGYQPKLEPSEELKDDNENNYLRLANLLFKIAPPAVRSYFDREFNPGGLQSVLNQNRFEKLQPLKNKRVINQKQWDVMFPQSGIASSFSFDLTLMICLIRHLTKIKILDSVPPETDESIGASLSTIKFYRNSVAHSDHKTMCYEEFNTQWCAITKAIVRIGGHSYEKICNDLQSYKLDKEILVEMQNMSLPSNPIPRGVQDVIDHKINQWRTSLDKVIKTSAMTSLIQLLEQKSLVIVTGPSGCGKSTVVHFVAVWLQDQQDHDIVPANFPSDLTQYYNPDRKQLFVFDDVCGKFSIDQQMVKTWNTLANDILKIFEKKRVKVLMSCKSHIYLHRIFQSLKLPLDRIDLLASEYALSNEEKDLIAQVYLSKSQIQTLNNITNLSEYDCFPLLCQLFPSSKTDDIVKFFTSPVEVIKGDLLSLLHDENDQTTIATLGLLVLFNNCITEHNLTSKDSEVRLVLDHLSDTCVTVQILSLAVIKRQLTSLENSYVKKTRGKYSIIHDKVFDILSSFFGEHMFDLVVEHSRPEFMRDRFLLESLNENADECVIRVPRNKEMLFFDRLYNDIINGNSFCVFTNHQLQFDLFRDKFIENLTRRIKSNECLILSTDISPLLGAASKGHNDIVKMLVTTFKLTINVCDKKGRTPLYLASENGHFETVRLLLEYNADRNICRTDYWQKGESPLYIASSKGYLDIVKLLCVNKNDCSAVRQDDFYKGRTSLHEASDKGHSEVVNYFISLKCDFNVINENSESPLWLASKKGHDKIVQLLLNDGVKPNVHTKKNGTPLCIASWYGSTEVVKMLLNNNADPFLGNQKKCTPLHFASREGHVEIVSLLLQNKVNPNTSYFRFTPLYLATVNNRPEVVELLLKQKADPNILSGNKMSPVYAASMKGHAGILSILIRFKANVNICNLQNRSPLFIAASNGMVEIVKILLTVGARPHTKTKDGEDALSIAQKKHYDDIVEILRNYQKHPRINEFSMCNYNTRSSTLTINTEHQINTNSTRPRVKSCCTVS